MWLCVVLVARPISVGQSRALARACKMFVKHFHDEAVLRSSDDINFAFRLRYHLLISRCVIICYRQTILDFVWYFFFWKVEVRRIFPIFCERMWHLKFVEARNEMTHERLTLLPHLFAPTVCTPTLDITSFSLISSFLSFLLWYTKL